MTQIIDSDRRCPRDGKRMVLEIGQADSGAQDRFSNRAEMVHICFNCDYREIDRNWRRPKLGPSAADRLLSQRLGIGVPIVYDDAPWPTEEWSDA